MTGSMIVNNLAGLMMLTSLFVISVKSYRLSCGFYACQSLVLVSIFATLSCLFAAEQLLIWSASAFITKVLLVPLIMTYAARNIPQNIPEKALFGPAMMALLAALIVLLCAFVVQPVKLPMATGLKPALAVALGHFLLGLLCIVSQRNILRQIFGYCLMENGSHLVLALLALQTRTGTGVDNPRVNGVPSLGQIAPAFAQDIGQTKVSLEVHAHHRIPIVFAQADKHPVAQDTGVVDQHVDFTKGCQCGIDNQLRRGNRGDVIGIGNRLPAALTNLAHHVFSRFTANVVHHHIGALLGKRQRISAAQATASAGNNHGTSFTNGHLGTPKDAQ